MTHRKSSPYFRALAAAVLGSAALAAHAETAGHVRFVFGPVTVTSSGGQTRTLHRGDDIASGDRISTNSGRVQLYFSDGGFVQLFPKTEFSVDQYVYANRKPQDTSLLFSLLRGGMRTITGVIGHINKASYRVNTPVATIGIRGTEYLAEFDGQSLNVGVGIGSVAIANNQGNITITSGQAAIVTPGQSPKQTDHQPTIGAVGTSGSKSSNSDSGSDSNSNSNSSSSGSGSGSSSGSGSGSNGTTQTASVTQPTTGNQQSGGLPKGVDVPSGGSSGAPLGSTSFGLPLYGFALASGSPAGSLLAGTSVFAGFDASGNVNKVNSNGSVIFDNTASGGLQYTNVVTEPGITIGDVTNGQAASGLTAASGQYLPFVVGVAGPAPAPLGVVSYQLANSGDATSAVLFSQGKTTTGSVSNFAVTVDLSQLLVGVNLQLLLNSATPTQYSVTGSGSAGNLLQSGGFQLGGRALTVASSACPNSTCSATVGGFFAGQDGSRLGSSYDITTPQGDILGTAALTQKGPALLVNTPNLPNSKNGSPSFTFAVPVSGNSNTSVLQANLQATFDGSGNLASVLDPNGKLIFANPASGTVVAPSTTPSPALQYNNTVILGSLSYSEVTNGAGTLSVGGVASGNGTNTSNTLSIGSGLYVPYILGVSGAAPSLPVINYTLQGATSPRADLQLGGVLNHFNLSVDVSSLQLSADLALTMGGIGYSMVAANQSVPNLVQSGTFNLVGLPVSSTNCVTQACSGSIQGFFAGSSTTQGQIGAGYSINVGKLDQINGVAALGQVAGGNALAYQSNSYGGNNQLGISTFADSSGLLDAAGLGRNNGSGTQVAADTTVISSGKTAQTAAASDGTLQWGRWIAGNPSVNGVATANVLSNTDSLHYVTGLPTAATTISAINAQGGSVTYNLEGATSPTDGSTAGSLTAGSLKVQFGGQPTMAVDLQVAMGSRNYAVSGSGALNPVSPQFGIKNLATNGCSASTCGTDVAGFFAGAQANKVGLTYSINDTTTTRGAAAFGR